MSRLVCSRCRERVRVPMPLEFESHDLLDSLESGRTWFVTGAVRVAVAHSSFIIHSEC